ncbi:MAG: PEP-CTERM sorting domain-containing protein [Phycisphaerales bacterium]|nr:PEP-CTERM sorting domain-containing protein [Phycisphaerales bacterium]
MNRCTTALATAGVLLAAGAAHANVLTTEVPPNNGSGGVWMNLTDLTPAGEFLVVNKFELGGLGGTVGTDAPIEVWTRPGTYVGNVSDPTGWTLTQTLMVTRNGATVSSDMPLTSNIVVPDGETVAVYLQALEAGGIRYFGNASNPPLETYADSNLEIFSNQATTASVAFPTAGIFTPRAFSGSVHYEIVPAPASAALLGLGGLVALRRRR